VRLEGKLTNSDGEFLASGPCEINHDRAEVTMWPSWELHMLERERGPLTLTLSDGRVLPISDRHLTLKLRGQSEEHVTVYRLRLLERVPEHLSAASVTPEEERIAELVREDEAARVGQAP
jgi:hypothetical protein